MVFIKSKNCPECGTKMAERTSKYGDYCACPNWISGICAGHLFIPSNPSWRVASKSEKGKMYNVKLNDKGLLYCDCPAIKECKHIKMIKSHYVVKDERKELEKTFYEIKKKGLLEEYKNYEDWEKSGK
jgi:hypothetical protein